MPSNLTQDLKPEDYRGATRRSVSNCVLARSLKKKYGGRWKVSKRVNSIGEGPATPTSESWAVRKGLRPKTIKLDDKDSRTMDDFDRGAPERKILRDARGKKASKRERKSVLDRIAPKSEPKPAPERKPEVRAPRKPEVRAPEPTRAPKPSRVPAPAPQPVRAPAPQAAPQAAPQPARRPEPAPDRSATPTGRQPIDERDLPRYRRTRSR